jgi:hypothetical protein
MEVVFRRQAAGCSCTGVGPGAVGLTSGKPAGPHAAWPLPRPGPASPAQRALCQHTFQGWQGVEQRQPAVAHFLHQRLRVGEEVQQAVKVLSAAMVSESEQEITSAYANLLKYLPEEEKNN